MATWIAKLAAMLTLNHSQFSAGLRTAGQETKAFSGGLRSATSVNAAYGDSLARAGVSSEKFALGLSKRLIGAGASIYALNEALTITADILDRMAAKPGTTFFQAFAEQSDALAESLKRTWVSGPLARLSLMVPGSLPWMLNKALGDPIGGEMRLNAGHTRQAEMVEDWARDMAADAKRIQDALGNERFTKAEQLSTRLHDIESLRKRGMLDDRQYSVALRRAKDEFGETPMGGIGRQLTSRQAFIGGAPATIGRVPVQMDQQVIDILRSIERKLEATPGRAG